MRLASIVFGVLCLGCFTPRAEAVILWSTDSGVPAGSRPLDDVVGTAGDGSCVAIAPNYVLDVRHTNIPGNTITLGSTTYNIVSEQDIGNADLRVFQITTMTGQPANLTDYVPLYTQTDEKGQTGIMGGFGNGNAGQNGNTITWGSDYGTLRWGNNVISGIDSTATVDGYPFVSEDLTTTFQNQGYTSHQAALAGGDSGGGLFVWTGSQYALAGVSEGVSEAGQSTVGDTNWFIRISSYAAAIEADTANTSYGVPEPSALLPVGAVAAFALLLRRREPSTLFPLA